MCEFKKRIEIDGEMFSIFNSEPYDTYKQAARHRTSWALRCGDIDKVVIIEKQGKFAIYYR